MTVTRQKKESNPPYTYIINTKYQLILKAHTPYTDSFVGFGVIGLMNENYNRYIAVH